MISNFTGGAVESCESGAAEPGSKADAANPEGAQFFDGEWRCAFDAHEYVDRLAHRGAERADVSRLSDSGSIEDAGAGGFIGLQAANGVVEVGTAVEVVLSAGDKHEGKGKPARGGNGCGDAFYGMIKVVDGFFGVA